MFWALAIYVWTNSKCDPVTSLENKGGWGGLGGGGN